MFHKHYILAPHWDVKDGPRPLSLVSVLSCNKGWEKNVNREQEGSCGQLEWGRKGLNVKCTYQRTIGAHRRSEDICTVDKEQTSSISRSVQEPQKHSKHWYLLRMSFQPFLGRNAEMGRCFLKVVLQDRFAFANDSIQIWGNQSHGQTYLPKDQKINVLNVMTSAMLLTLFPFRNEPR